VVDLCLWWTDTHWQVWMWREIKEKSWYFHYNGMLFRKCVQMFPTPATGLI
jgi:hypothetical protein